MKKNLYKDIIYNDDIFIHIKNYIQEAIIYHELVHIKSKTFTVIISMNFLNEVKNILTYNKKTKELILE